MQRLAAPAVTLMHNGSSYHALPALLSDLHEAVGALASGNSSAGECAVIVELQPEQKKDAKLDAVPCSSGWMLKPSTFSWFMQGLTSTYRATRCR